jgi:hypothetical protein
MKRTSVSWVLIFLWLAAAASAETLWQIGRFDESSAEFSPIVDPHTGQRRIDYGDADQDPVFIVGRSAPDRDWFSFQPGTANGATGFRAHPFTVQFELAEVREGTYRLRVHLLAYSTRLPFVQVEINGHRGRLYQRPELIYSAGDPGVFFLPHYAKSILECELPRGFLIAGLNRLSLTPVDEPGDRDDVRPSGYAWPGNSGVVYDALSLEWTDPAARSAGTPLEALVSPAIFYKIRDGQLLEEVDAFVGVDGPAVSKVAEFEMEGKKYSRKMDANLEFGEQRLTFEVPEFAPGTKGRLVLDQNGGKATKEFVLTPARKWELLIVPNEHLDIGYTDFDWKVAELQSRTVEAAMRLVSDNPDFRFTFDGFWIIEQFLRSRTPAVRERLGRLMKEGKLSVPAVYGSTFTAFSSLENLIRGLYPSKRWALECGSAFDFALVTDVPSCSWSYASVLAAAGVKYLAVASDAYRAPFLLYNRFHERSPHQWEGPDGGRVLTWYSRHYHQVASLFGMPPQLAQGRDSLPRFLQAYQGAEYRAGRVLVYGTQVENTALHPAQAAFVAEWNRIYAYPRLRYAGLDEAIAQIAQEQETNLQVARGDGGPYWEDGLGANARITSLARQNMYRATTAEIFSTISARLDPSLSVQRFRLERLWENLLLTDEHTWHADQSTRDPDSEQSVRQGAAKEGRVLDAKRLIDEQLGQSLAAIAQNIRRPGGTITLFNSLSWARRGLVELDLPKGRGLFDEHDQPVAYEPLYSGNHFERVRVLSPEIPSVGYLCLGTGPSPGTGGQPASLEQPYLEGPHYRVELDPAAGSIRSVYDKKLGRELVDSSSEFRFGQYLYVSGADTLPNRLVQYSTVSPLPELKIHSASGGKVMSVRRTALGMAATLVSTNYLAPRIETEIMLLDALRQIHITIRLEKRRTLQKEAAYVAFPFAMSDPTFRYATQNGYVNPAQDMLPGAGLEWFTVHHWLAVTQGGTTVGLVPVDAPLVTLGDIARGTWPKEFGRRPGTVFSYVMNNYTPEGYQAGQGGEFTFRYVLTSGPDFDPSALHQFGLEMLTPIEKNEITKNDKLDGADGPLNGFHGAFAHIDSTNVSLVTWKSAEDGQGTILRFVEVAGKANLVTVTLPVGLTVQSARECTAVEDNLTPLPSHRNGFRFQAKPFSIVTVRLETDGQP